MSYYSPLLAVCSTPLCLAGMVRHPHQVSREEFIARTFFPDFLHQFMYFPSGDKVYATEDAHEMYFRYRSDVHDDVLPF